MVKFTRVGDTCEHKEGAQGSMPGTGEGRLITAYWRQHDGDSSRPISQRDDEVCIEYET